MYYKEDFINDMEKMGLKNSDVLMVHSSMKSIGQTDGGADTVVDAFMEYLSDGLFMTPAHTWAQMGEEHDVFDPDKEPACVGIIPNVFLKKPGVVRSLHPTHSIAAFGRNVSYNMPACEYILGEEECNTPCTPGGCWDRLRNVNAKILLLGVNHVKNTFIHAVEEVLDVPERFTQKPAHFKIKMPNGNLKEVLMYRHFNKHTEHISESFEKLSEAFFETGAAKRVMFGDAQCILCDANKLFEVTKKVLSHEINCLIDRENIPKEWWN